MTLAVAEALNPNKPNQTNTEIVKLIVEGTPVEPNLVTGKMVLDWYPGEKKCILISRYNLDIDHLAAVDC